jgi:hypothetical protein
VWTLAGVSPNYIATAYVQLAPPTSQPTQPGEQSLEQRNPWIGLGLYNLANAAILTVQQASVVESLKASGLSDTFTATLNSSSPLVTFEVTGASEQQAIDTTNALIQRFSASITDLQVQTYSVNSKDLVVARRIDFGANVKQSDGRVKRAVVAVAVLGLLLTLALTIGLDALLSRRARVRAGLPAGVGTADLSPPQVARSDTPVRVSSLYDRAVGSDRSSGPQLVTERGREYPDGSRSAGAERSGGTAVDPGTLAVPLPASAGGEGHRVEDSGTLSTLGAAYDDATVLLPLTHRSARRNDNDGEETRPR